MAIWNRSWSNGEGESEQWITQTSSSAERFVSAKYRSCCFDKDAGISEIQNVVLMVSWFLEVRFPPALNIISRGLRSELSIANQEASALRSVSGQQKFYQQKKRRKWKTV